MGETGRLDKGYAIPAALCAAAWQIWLESVKKCRVSPAGAIDMLVGALWSVQSFAPVEAFPLNRGSHLLAHLRRAVAKLGQQFHQTFFDVLPLSKPCQSIQIRLLRPARQQPQLVKDRRLNAVMRLGLLPSAPRQILLRSMVKRLDEIEHGRRRERNP